MAGDEKEVTKFFSEKRASFLFCGHLSGGEKKHSFFLPPNWTNASWPGPKNNSWTKVEVLLEFLNSFPHTSTEFAIPMLDVDQE